MSTAAAVNASVSIVPWRDDRTDECGYPPHSPEFVRHWAPLLGPAATTAYQILADLAGSAPAGATRSPAVDLDLETMAAAIGVAPRKAATLVLAAIERLERFDLIVTDLPDVAVRVAAPALSRRLLHRVPPAWRDYLDERSSVAVNVPGG